MLVNRAEDFAEGSVNIYLDGAGEENGGKLIGTVDLSADAYAAGEAVAASDGTEWHWVSGAFTEPVEGIHSLYLIFEADEDGQICNFDQFTFGA